MLCLRPIRSFSSLARPVLLCMVTIFFSLALTVSASTAGTIGTIAGIGVGDGLDATTAVLNYPVGTTIDSAGNLYIADRGNHRIRKIDTSGVITTVAGNGAGGYSGDDGSATAAQLFYPTAVTVDSAGNLYIADRNNHRIRKVDTGGVITTVAGTGISGYSGDDGSGHRCTTELSSERDHR